MYSLDEETDIRTRVTRGEMDFCGTITKLEDLGLGEKYNVEVEIDDGKGTKKFYGLEDYLEIGQRVLVTYCIKPGIIARLKRLIRREKYDLMDVLSIMP